MLPFTLIVLSTVSQLCTKTTIATNESEGLPGSRKPAVPLTEISTYAVIIELLAIVVWFLINV